MRGAPQFLENSLAGKIGSWNPRGGQRRRGYGGPEGSQAGLFEVVAVEEVIGVEGDEAAIGMGDVDTGFFDRADIEGMGVEELDDEDAKNIFVAEIGGSGDARKTAEQFAKAGGAGFR